MFTNIIFLKLNFPFILKQFSPKKIYFPICYICTPKLKFIFLFVYLLFILVPHSKRLQSKLLISIFPDHSIIHNKKWPRNSQTIWRMPTLNQKHFTFSKSANSYIGNIDLKMQKSVPFRFHLSSDFKNLFYVLQNIPMFSPQKLYILSMLGRNKVDNCTHYVALWGK